MKKTHHYLKLALLLLLIPCLSQCARNIILLSPEDHFALGSYYIEQKDFDNATNQFEEIRDNYPTSEYSTMSQFKLAQTEFSRKKYSEAAIDFELFLEFHPAHKLAPIAQYNLALSKYHSMLTPDRDNTIMLEALREFQKFLALYPDYPDYAQALQYKNKVEDRLSEHDLEVGLVYYRRTFYNSAIDRIEPVAQKIHDAELKSKTLYFLGRCYEKRNEYEQAKTVYSDAIASGSQSDWIKKAKKRIKELPQSAS